MPLYVCLCLCEHIQSMPCTSLGDTRVGRMRLSTQASFMKTEAFLHSHGEDQPMGHIPIRPKDSAIGKPSFHYTVHARGVESFKTAPET